MGPSVKLNSPSRGFLFKKEWVDFVFKKKTIREGGEGGRRGYGKIPYFFPIFFRTYYSLKDIACPIAHTAHLHVLDSSKQTILDSPPYH